MSDDLSKAFDEGLRACDEGKRLTENPYGAKAETPLSIAWTRGWRGRHEAMMMDLRYRAAKNP